MREIDVMDVRAAVAGLCQEAAVRLPEDVLSAIRKAAETELSDTGRAVLEHILENASLAAQTGVSLCQDGGVTVVFLEVGQEVHFTGGSLEEAIHAGIGDGYRAGHVRGSILDRPFEGRNTGDNTPGVIHYAIVPGDRVRVTVLPKGGGADNMSQLRMLTPAAGVDGVKRFVMEVVEAAGPNACPPLIVGVGIGGTFDSVGMLAKRALLRPVGAPHPDPSIARLEEDLCRAINGLGLGPMGLGGTVTALAVHIETYPLHMASLPVAVNLQCHSARVKSTVL
ncbi:fumarate hydratase [Alicyclobacillus macrosporangiidus]|uniref:fumarate hydratase n=1 Tax=Alicyclobacillus macrosporangiidus TaxID=392015 RepID=UPI0026EE9175|nr:fumarate hydratase [Alicyclobacillus macrosporangiidus]